MFQLLHFADLHLDASFAANGLSPTVGAWRRTDLRATLGRILTLARERQVDTVTIAGDLYEQDYALPDTANFLKQQFAKLAPMRVFIAPGQHDPHTHDSLYVLTQWPENVFIFSRGRLEDVELAPGIHLWGAAHPLASGYRLLKEAHLNRQDVNLLLIHAPDLEQPERRGEVPVVDVTTIREAGFSCALLGGLHNGCTWPDTLYCIYPGSPEPLSLTEADGAHQVVLLSIQDQICTPEFISINQWRYQSLTVDLTGCTSNDAAANRIEKMLGNVGPVDERLICYITLTGQPDFDLDANALAEQVKTKAHVHYKTRLSLPYDLERLAQEQTVRGELVRRFQARLADTVDNHKRRLAINALNVALQALDGKKALPYEIE